MPSIDDRTTLFIPPRAMVLMAHPDDPEFFCGGTVARWAQAGSLVAYVIMTNGNKGSSVPDMTPTRITAMRQIEQRTAAQRLGVQEVIFLDYNDGELFPTLQLREDLVYQLRRYRPDAVICQDPTTYFVGDSRINHPDHRAAGEAVLAAVFPLARDRLNFPHHEANGLTPHAVQHVLVAGTNEPNYVVDITDVIDLKIAAIHDHTSQISDPAAIAARIRERATAVTADGRTVYREQFRYIKLA
jgi:LmbE family N-acetylglucosaminyl deacetylase